MSGADGFCYENRPPLERLRILCTGCFAFDCIFVLVYGLTAFRSAGATTVEACYEAHGYTWHYVMTLAITVWVMAALGAAMCHLALVTSQVDDEERTKKLQNISRVAHGLICWSLVAAVLEAIAYREEPLECHLVGSAQTRAEQRGGDLATGNGEHSAGDPQSDDRLWEVGYTMLWLAWVTSSLGTGILAKRVSRMTPEEANAPPMDNTDAAAQGQQMQTRPQTVGAPQMQDGAILVTGNPMTGPAAATAAQGAPTSNSGWSGAPTGSQVCTGMPVSAPPDPEKGGCAKTTS